MDGYVINLKDRTDRWSHIQNKLANFPITLNRFDAHRGKVDAFSLSPFVKSCLLYKENCTKYHMESMGSLGCAMSHIALWKNLTATSFIFEDDADPLEFAKQDIQKAIELIQNDTYDFIFLGSHSPPTLKGTTLIPWTHGGKVSTGAWAYILTPRAAQKLLQYIEPLDLQIDLFIQTVPLRFGYIPCFKQRFFLRPPDIQHYEEKLYSTNQLYQYMIGVSILAVLVTFLFLRLVWK